MKALPIIIFFLSSYVLSAQSVTLSQQYLEIPKVAFYPACTVIDRGKVIYYVNTNKLYYCNGSQWVTQETDNLLTPAFKASSSYDLSINNTLNISFIQEGYDLAANFNLANAPVNPSSFVAPVTGVYHFNVSAVWDLSEAMVSNDSYIEIDLSVNTTGGSSTHLYPFSAVATHYFHTPIGCDIYLYPGDKVSLRFSEYQMTGKKIIREVIFSGFIVK